jgi:hypothetical protein
MAKKESTEAIEEAFDLTAEKAPKGKKMGAKKSRQLAVASAFALKAPKK